MGDAGDKNTSTVPATNPTVIMNRPSTVTRRSARMRRIQYAPKTTQTGADTISWPPAASMHGNAIHHVFGARPDTKAAASPRTKALGHR